MCTILGQRRCVYRSESKVCDTKHNIFASNVYADRKVWNAHSSYANRNTSTELCSDSFFSFCVNKQYTIFITVWLSRVQHQEFNCREFNINRTLLLSTEYFEILRDFLRAITWNSNGFVRRYMQRVSKHFRNMRRVSQHFRALQCSPFRIAIHRMDLAHSRILLLRVQYLNISPVHKMGVTQPAQRRRQQQAFNVAAVVVALSRSNSSPKTWHKHPGSGN